MSAPKRKTAPVVRQDVGAAELSGPIGVQINTPGACPECGNTKSLTGFCHGFFLGPIRRRHAPTPEYLANGEWMI